VEFTRKCLAVVKHRDPKYSRFRLGFLLTDDQIIASTVHCDCVAMLWSALSRILQPCSISEPWAHTKQANGSCAYFAKMQNEWAEETVSCFCRLYRVAASLRAASGTEWDMSSGAQVKTFCSVYIPATPCGWQEYTAEDHMQKMWSITQWVNYDLISKSIVLIF